MQEPKIVYWSLKVTKSFWELWQIIDSIINTIFFALKTCFWVFSFCKKEKGLDNSKVKDSVVFNVLGWKNWKIYLWAGNVGI